MKQKSIFTFIMQAVCGSFTDGKSSWDSNFICSFTEASSMPEESHMLQKGNDGFLVAQLALHISQTWLSQAIYTWYVGPFLRPEHLNILKVHVINLNSIHWKSSYSPSVYISHRYENYAVIAGYTEALIVNHSLYISCHIFLAVLIAQTNDNQLSLTP